ncbi:MAG: DNA-binding response regulator [Flammeovirgaceae bacterium]|nr:DNA-binding response regulator [Flammeovirgaceae bacterium]MBE62909.1 DNA-binding response regulator [Flammeovirgaceae bacterium]MBR07594.1 DNA-binding response regulator [Rickettsiales bacterium]HCX25179.1 DNA-binding response regulator [Cytophagales bacterium]|tara:strand:+ start:986 stop:1684 length:699 start_codon:yes stop_codon:yes gene_type:complete
MKILLVEDDAAVCSMVNKGLVENGFDVTVGMNGKQGIDLSSTVKFDLIILDIMLPDINGLEVCREIRKADKRIPILFLTALGSAENVVLGLETGADDYLTKPFKFIELLARIKSLLRRTENQDSVSIDAFKFVFEDLTLDDHTKKVTRANSVVSLTSTEYRLLLMFMKNPGKVLSRTAMLDEVWGITFDLGTNVVDVYVNYLRKKLERANDKRIIHTVIGMGYVLRSDEDPQ